MTQMTHPECPHCGGRMSRWANPQASTWGGEYQFVCFNDRCSYFVRGWAWMMGRYNVAASYRFRIDPFTGERGPLPVWSAAALKGNLIETPEEERVNAV